MTPQDLNKPIHVLKFGGTSVANPELIRNAAQRIARRRDSGVHVVCVVSAMGDTTDRLLSLAREISTRPPSRELDVLLSAGEVQSMAPRPTRPFRIAWCTQNWAPMNESW